MILKPGSHKMIYGTAWKEGRTAELVVEALETGFRGIDSAAYPAVNRVLQILYCKSQWAKHHNATAYFEKGVGDGLREALHTGIIKREDLFIQTKCVANILVWALALTALQHGFTPAKYQEVEPLPYDRSAPIGEQVAQNLQTSLKDLGVEYFDCVLLHIPYQKKEDTLEAYRALEKAVNQGLIQHLGVSNIYDAEELEWLIANTKVEIEVVQNRWNDHTKWDWSVFEVCRSRGIQYQSFGFLKSEALVNDEHLLSLASKHKITPQQAIYKLCQVWGMTPLCGSTKTTHMREAFSVEGMTGIKADDDDVEQVWEDLHIGDLGSAAESEDTRN